MTKLYPAILALIAVLAVSSFALVLGVNADPPAAKNFVAPLKGDQEVPPRDTPATGLAKFQLNAEGTELSFKVIAANINNVTASHIHCGAAGVSGPVGVNLFLGGGLGPTDGILAQGIITAPNAGNACGWVTLVDVANALRSGDTYVNVHTNDGVAPANTGPGDFPGGEIRGQIKVAGPK